MIDPATAMLAVQASACQLVFDTLTHEHDMRAQASCAEDYVRESLPASRRGVVMLSDNGFGQA
jgi:hypothetical protein